MRSLALVFALAIAGAAHADTTLRYTVLFAGKPAGSETTVVANDGSVRVSYLLKDGGSHASAGICESFGIRRFADPPHITRSGGS